MRPIGFWLHSEAMSNDLKLCCLVAFFFFHRTTQKMNPKKRTHQMKCIRLTMKRPPLAFLHESTRVVGSCMHWHTARLYRVKINLEKTKQETKKKWLHEK